jgi:hypothetical protein
LIKKPKEERLLMNEIKPIQNWSSLRAAREQLRVRIREREGRLETAWKQIPEETLKMAIGAVLPAFLSERLAGGLLGVIRGAWSFLGAGKTGEEGAEWRTYLGKTLRQVGVFGLLRLILGFFGGKNREKPGKI